MKIFVIEGEFLMQIILTLWTHDYDGPQFIWEGK